MRDFEVCINNSVHSVCNFKNDLKRTIKKQIKQHFFATKEETKKKLLNYLLKNYSEISKPEILVVTFKINLKEFQDNPDFRLESTLSTQLKGT